MITVITLFILNGMELLASYPTFCPGLLGVVGYYETDGLVHKLSRMFPKLQKTQRGDYPLHIGCINCLSFTIHFGKIIIDISQARTGEKNDNVYLYLYKYSTVDVLVVFVPVLLNRYLYWYMVHCKNTFVKMTLATNGVYCHG